MAAAARWQPEVHRSATKCKGEDAMVEPESQPAVTTRPSRGRSVAAAICIVVAALLTVPAATAFWGQRTLNDSQRYLETVGPLVGSPQVQAAIAETVTAAIQQQVDVEALLNQAFAGVISDRPRLLALVGPMSGAVNGLIESQVRTFIASDAFARFWVTANTRAQAGLVRLLQGDQSGAVSLQGDQVVLDVSEIIDQVKQRLVARGLTMVDRVPIPDKDRQVVLLDAPQLNQARTIYAFANPVANWLIVVVALLYLAALLLSRHRPRMTMIIGAVLAANALLVVLLLAVGRQLFVNQLTGTVFGPASAVFFDQLLSFLQRGQQVLLWVGVILVLVGWFTRPTGAGAAARGAVSGGLTTLGSALSNGRVAGAGRWVTANARWLRVAIGIVAVVLLLWGNDVSLSRLFWALAFVGVLLAVVEIMKGAARETAG
jgi:hypothetical protein